MRTSIFSLVLAALLLAGAMTPAVALTTIPRDLDQLVARADGIFRGTALSAHAAWKGEGPNRHIVTRVTFQVGETYKGAEAAQQTLEFFGGELDGLGMGVADMPTFTVGEEAVLFVEGNGQQICPLVGADQGVFRTARPSGSSIAHVLRAGGGAIASVDTIGRSGAETHTTATARGSVAQSITADAFRAEILQRVARQKQGLLQVQD